ncbi:Lyr motif-containing protein 4 [Globisporangium polare]
MASKQQVLRLYKEMLRNASKFEGYNFRKYAERRVKEDFHKNKSLAAGSAEQQQALAHAQEQAGVLYRQVVISKMYPPESHSIMESL